MNVSPADSGTVRVNERTLSSYPATSEYASGVRVSLEAVPASGYRFSNWGGDLSGAANPATITMDCGRNVTANFSEAGTNWKLPAVVGGAILDIVIGGTVVWLLVRSRKARHRVNT